MRGEVAGSRPAVYTHGRTATERTIGETEFQDSPVIPLAYLVHERKLTYTHDIFFRHIAEVCPVIAASPQILFITDSEQAIRTSLSKHFPSTKAFSFI